MMLRSFCRRIFGGSTCTFPVLPYNIELFTVFPPEYIQLSRGRIGQVTGVCYYVSF